MDAPAPIPYVVGQWVRGERFYGRTQILTEILDGPRESLWLLGTRRIGKTSVLKQLEHLTSTDESPFVPLFWDLQGADNPSELHLSFYDALLDAEDRFLALGAEMESLDEGDLFASLSRLRRHLGRTGKRLLLLCDEAEELINIHAQDPSILRKLRRALQSGGEVRSVMTSTIRLWALADERGDTSPFLHGFTPPLYLSTLSDTEGEALLQQTHLPQSLRPRMLPDAAHRISRECGNHPYLLQLMAKRALELGDVDAAIDSIMNDEMVSYFFAVDFEMLSPDEQRILRITGESGTASSSMLEERTELTSSRVTAGLLRLESLGFVRSSENRQLKLANGFFRRWLCELTAPIVGSNQDGPTKSREILDERYEILEPIGEGATGIVYLAKDRLLDVDLAIKILRPEYRDDTQILERFRQEIVLSRDLAHPNILRVYHLGESDGRRYLTMQWVDGPTLARVIREEGALSESVVVHVGLKIASALEAAHDHKVLHRDIKPSNILLDRSGEPKLTDFGLARQLDDPRITNPGMFLGTPDYVSPEQAAAEPVDGRTDLYSLGVVLFEMATGRRPFEGDSIQAVLKKHRTETPPSPRDLRSEISVELSDLILGCLEKSPERRISSARELRTSLQSMA
ncbi:MAG: protein kinase [Acidobacteriota bacterium]